MKKCLHFEHQIGQITIYVLLQLLKLILETGLGGFKFYNHCDSLYISRLDIIIKITFVLTVNNKFGDDNYKKYKIKYLSIQFLKELNLNALSLLIKIFF